MFRYHTSRHWTPKLISQARRTLITCRVPEGYPNNADWILTGVQIAIALVTKCIHLDTYWILIGYILVDTYLSEKWLTIGGGVDGALVHGHLCLARVVERSDH